MNFFGLALNVPFSTLFYYIIKWTSKKLNKTKPHRGGIFIEISKEEKGDPAERYILFFLENILT